MANYVSFLAKHERAFLAWVASIGGFAVLTHKQAQKWLADNGIDFYHHKSKDTIPDDHTHYSVG